MQRKLSADFPLSQMAIQKGINSFDALLNFTQHLAYGRNKNRTELNLVLEEEKGTCSSKHAFIKKIAEENGWDDIKLMIGIYKMNHINTPNIGTTLIDHGLDFIPEAHCYLKIEENRIDITNPTASFKNVKKDILEEHYINSAQVNTFKVDLHKTFLKNWIAENDINFAFEALWEIREKCIQKLSES